jgi:pimeloyl-ACP methyl ester carboxylesterase
MRVEIYTTENSVQSETEAPRLTLFFHGFPGLRSKQNRDLAEQMARSTGRPSYVFLYPGLTQAEGSFSFPACLDAVHRQVESLLGIDEFQVDLVGHSWGGFLGLSLLSRFPTRIRRAVLLSPLLSFGQPDSESHILTEKAFEKMGLENPDLKLGHPSILAEEFRGVGLKYPAESIIGGISDRAEILILQSRLDEITPADVAMGYLSYFKKKPFFELVETDHSFLLNRSATSERIQRFLK